MEGYFVYILADRKKGELYVGMAKNMKRRIRELGRKRKRQRENQFIIYYFSV